MKCCTKLETAKERCPIVFQGHPSNFKVTRYKTSPILTQIGRFRTIGQSQLSNPSDLPCSRSSVKFQGHTALKIVEFDPKWAFPDCNSSWNSPMAMKCCTKLETAKERCPIVFQGHPSNFKVTRNITDFDPNWAFPDYRPVAAFKSLRFALFKYLRYSWKWGGRPRAVSNYTNPVYGVATICHQVGCSRWGHPSLFHTATSLLISYKLSCMRDIS